MLEMRVARILLPKNKADLVRHDQPFEPEGTAATHFQEVNSCSERICGNFKGV